MDTNKVRQEYLDFYAKKGHKIIPSASLVPEDDPTTLFTGFGMQPMLSFLLGKPHPLGKRVADSQKSFRSEDIQEVGDGRHTTFFEMLGNWSFGDYFKKEQLEWLFSFLTDKIKLEPNKLFATVFGGNASIPRDFEAVKIWQKLFKSAGVRAKDIDSAQKKGLQDGRIFYYGAEKNWWSRAGIPEKMPPGEPGGPDSEIFFDFGAERKIHESSKYKNLVCHINCNCGRFFEIGNSVFMTYRKEKDGSFTELKQKNIDFGGGLERITAAAANQPDIFQTDGFSSLIAQIEKKTERLYKEKENKFAMQIIADHLKGAVFLIADGVRPSNKDQGYFLRRLIRRSAVKMHGLKRGLSPVADFQSICLEVLSLYKGVYFDAPDLKKQINQIIKQELAEFSKALDRGLKKINKAPIEKINGKFVFDLYQSYGYPFEITQELLSEKGIKVERTDFESEYKKHQEVSRKGSGNKFKGGLADKSANTVKLHTATHLLHRALQEALGPSIQQKGSNITARRLRFDFTYKQKLTEKEIHKVEDTVNQKIKQNLTVWSEIMDKKQAEKIGASAYFGEKYPEKVSVYFIGKEKNKKKAYSKEFCAGPHVSSTYSLGKFKIIKEKSASSGVRRIYAIV